MNMLSCNLVSTFQKASELKKNIVPSKWHPAKKWKDLEKAIVFNILHEVASPEL